MRFELAEGGFTILFFYKDSLGVTHPFPVENMNIVLNGGTEESIEMLNKIIKDGFTSLEDRMYIAFMGPPIPPYEIKCYCGHTVKMGHDDQGYYIEGASKVIFNSRKKSSDEEVAEPE